MILIFEKMYEKDIELMKSSEYTPITFPMPYDSMSYYKNPSDSLHGILKFSLVEIPHSLILLVLYKSYLYVR